MINIKNVFFGNISNSTFLYLVTSLPSLGLSNIGYYEKTGLNYRFSTYINDKVKPL